jgi:hypothetical protein
MPLPATKLLKNSLIAHLRSGRRISWRTRETVHEGKKALLREALPLSRCIPIRNAWYSSKVPIALQRWHIRQQAESFRAK